MLKLRYRKALDSIPSYIPGKPIKDVKRELGLEKVIKLASNENPLGCSPKVKEAVLGFIEKASSYPDGHCAELAEILAEEHSVSLQQLAFGAGSFELISLVAQTFISAGDTVIMPVPSFRWYHTATRLMDGEVKEVPLTKHRIDLSIIKESINEKVKVIWLCNPNNPTGTIITDRELEEFLDWLPSDVVVVLDEAYYDYVTDENYPKSIRLVEKYPNIIVLRTFSKIYGLASMRIAYAVSNAENILQLNKVRQIFNVNAAAQVAAIASLKDIDFKKAGQKNNLEGKEYLYRVFKGLGLEYILSHGNFIMVNTGLDSREVYEKLLKKGVIIRPGEHFKMNSWIRVSIGTMEENEIFAREFIQLIESKYK